jgi:hypothetical protein
MRCGEIKRRADWRWGALAIALSSTASQANAQTIIQERTGGGYIASTQTIGGRLIAGSGTVAAYSELAGGGVVLPGKVTTVPANAPTAPITVQLRYGIIGQNVFQYTNVPSFVFDKPNPGPAVAIHNNISASSTFPNNIALSNANSVQNFSPTGAPANAVISGSANVKVVGGNTGDAVFYAADPITFSGPSQYNLDPQITSLDLGGNGNFATLQFDAYSSLVPAPNGALGLLFSLGFSLINGVFGDYFDASPLLGYPTQPDRDAFLNSLVANNLVVTGGPDASITLKDPTNGFSLFGSGIPLSIGSNGATFSFDTQGYASAVPEPSTWALMLLGFAGLAYAGCGSTSGGRNASAAA